ncbi:MAG: Small-conductance mechanosensitive ion channel-like protein [Parcubacteria bacterium C7867-004]|nr:MAG: Small-conductance mechanosensitive ion channel-like protein [Parcubacteria bacterium C7867-004]
MFLSTWANVLMLSFQNLFYGLVAFIPALIVALVIFVIGWLVGAFLGRLVAQAVSALRVDQALRAAGVERVFDKAGYTLNAGAFLGFLVKWFFIIVFLVAALDVLGLTQVTDFLTGVVLTYIPQVIVAVLILLVAAVLAEAAQRVIAGGARAAGIRAANLLGTLARWAIWIFAVLVALDRLGVSPLIQTLFTGVVVALSLAFGLAFGLGGQQAAAKYIERMQQEIK